MAAGYGNHPELYEEVKLYKSTRERQQFDHLAELYAIINTLQLLENANLKDHVNSREYIGQCSKLLTQMKAAFKVVQSETPGEYADLESFIEKNRMNCPLALDRIKDDRPITVKDDKGNVGRSIAQIVALFITIMDKLRLNINSVDELLNDIKELLDLILRLTTLPYDYKGRDLIRKWVDKLSSMSATSELTEEEGRQMIMDLDSAYREFEKALASF